MKNLPNQLPKPRPCRCKISNLGTQKLSSTSFSTKSFEPLHQNLWPHAQGWQHLAEKTRPVGPLSRKFSTNKRGSGTGDPNITSKRTLEMARLGALLESSPCKSTIFIMPWGIWTLAVVIREALDGKTRFGFEKNSFHKTAVFVASRSLWLHALKQFCPNCASGKGCKT